MMLLSTTIRDPLGGSDRGLRGATLGLARSLLYEEPALLRSLVDVKPSGASSPLHHWTPAELAELQWEPLAAAAIDDREWVQSHAAVEGDRLVEAIDAVRRHARLEGKTLSVGDAPVDLRRQVALLPASQAAAAVGWRRNDQLLLDEGWADADLASDACALPDAVLRTAVERVGGAELATKAARAGQIEVLDALGQLRYLSGEAVVLPGGLVTDELGRTVQALCLAQEQLSSVGAQGCAISIGEAVPLSVEHERRVGAVLSRACAELLEGFATGLEQDEALLLELASRPPQHEATRDELAEEARRRQGFALRSRISRKRCLEACRAMCDAWVERPTAAGGTLRRPWKAYIRASG